MQTSDKIYDLIIIGGGPGGYTAALYAVRAGLKTLVIEMFSPGGQMAETDKIDNYPGFNEGIVGFDLAEKMAAGAESFGAETIFEEVREVALTEEVISSVSETKTAESLNRKQIITDRAIYEAEAVILATGAKPKFLGLKGEDMLRSRGIAYCAACDGMFYKGKTVAVIGSGNSAASDAVLLSNICSHVYFIPRHDMPNAEQVYLSVLENALNVEMLPNSEVTELFYDDKLTGLSVTDTISGTAYRINCDAAFIAIGRKPSTQLFTGQLDLTVQGYIMAGEDTKTNIPGVFAVGDVRTKPVRQIITAAADGAVAAKFAEEYIFSKRIKH